MSLDSQPEARNQMPFMDHWNVSRQHTSLRDIIKEQQALQENEEKVTQRPCKPADFSIFWPTDILNKMCWYDGFQPSFCQTRQNRADIDRFDGAALLKEGHLYALFPTIDRHFLQDIFRDNK